MTHGLPYEWRPLGALRWFDRDDWAHEDLWLPGRLIPWAHKVYALVEARDIPEDQWTPEERNQYHQRRRAWMTNPEVAALGGPLIPPRFFTFIPHPVPDDPVAHGRLRKQDKLVWRGWMGRHRHPDYYPDEHYPACAKCGEPAPCRESMSAKVAAQAAADMERWADPTMCPACHEVITTRQGRETFDMNLFMPGGPPVTFHTRRDCVQQLAGYRKKLADAGYFTPRETAS